MNSIVAVALSWLVANNSFILCQVLRATKEAFRFLLANFEYDLFWLIIQFEANQPNIHVNNLYLPNLRTLWQNIAPLKFQLKKTIAATLITKDHLKLKKPALGLMHNTDHKFIVVQFVFRWENPPFLFIIRLVI